MSALKSLFLVETLAIDALGGISRKGDCLSFRQNGLHTASSTITSAL
jgi:hypothetical protein